MTKRNKVRNPDHTRHVAYAGVLIALMAVCSWINIPTAVPFTLQTFAVNLALVLMGGRRGTMTIAGYLILGLVGAPVFAGFAGGPGAFLTPSGGFLIGFLAIGIVYRIITGLFGDGTVAAAFALIVGNIAMYVIGTLWFLAVYGMKNDISFLAALGICVVPFLAADGAKLALAVVVGRVLLQKTELFAKAAG